MVDNKQITANNQRIEGVVIGLLIGFNDKCQPLVAYPGNTEDTAIIARTTANIGNESLGKDVALLFEEGDPRRPLIIGLIHHPDRISNPESSITAQLDGENIMFSAEKNITLKCGKASITLTRAGKIFIRGTYLVSHSSGVNRIRGGTVHIN